MWPEATKTGSNRSYVTLREQDIERLLKIERNWRHSLEQRKEHWRQYAPRLLCVGIAQGGALHLIDGANGIKDFDIYRFFAKHPDRPDPDPAIYRGRTATDFGDPSRFGQNKDPHASDKVKRMKGRNVDIFSVALPVELGTEPVEAIQATLSAPRTNTERHLAAKAVVILDPRPYRVAWPPHARDELKGLHRD